MHVNPLEFGIIAIPESATDWRASRNVFDFDFHEQTGSWFQSEGNTAASIEINTIKKMMLR
jgi:hypothetical protein